LEFPTHFSLTLADASGHPTIQFSGSRRPFSLPIADALGTLYSVFWFPTHFSLTLADASGHPTI
jgi:hypothetical protein